MGSRMGAEDVLEIGLEVDIISCEGVDRVVDVRLAECGVEHRRGSDGLGESRQRNRLSV